ncbi:MAG: hypothetical protein ACRCSV_00645 [Chlamydiales bacterium]
MYSTNIISLAQINDHFLPKIAREYNITTDESQSRQPQTKKEESREYSPLIHGGLFSSLFSHNRVHVHSTDESKKKEKEKEPSSPNYLQLIVVASITAIASAFGLGRLRNSTTAAEENIWYSRSVLASPSNWNGTLSSKVASNIFNVVNTYYRAETDRKNKLANYQISLVGITAGIGISIAGACASAELLAIMGVITAVSFATFGAYQMAIHWDDFSRAQDEFKNLHLIDLLPQSRPFASAPPPPEWHPNFARGNY